MKIATLPYMGQFLVSGIFLIFSLFPPVLAQELIPLILSEPIAQELLEVSNQNVSFEEESFPPNEKIEDFSDFLENDVQTSEEHQEVSEIGLLDISLPSLLITEVFRQGTNEWIEITNTSSESFLGDLSLNGAKSSGLITISNANIPAHSSKVFSRADTAILHTGVLASHKIATSFTDGNAFNLQLLFSGELIDTFSVSADLITTHKSPNQRKSFEKVFQNGVRTILPTETSRIFNLSSDEIANPGRIYVIGGQLPRVGFSDEIYNFGNQEVGELFHDLRLTEIFYDEDFDWIEIFNLGSGAFHGDVVLSGTLTGSSSSSRTYPNLTIPAHSYLIIANTAEFFALTGGIVSSTINGNTKLNFPNNSSIHLQLVVSGQVQDELFADEYRVKKRKDFGVSFHKIFATPSGILTWSMTHDAENLSDEYENERYFQANPGIVHTFAENITDYSKPKDRVPDSEPISECDDATEDLIQISEIFWGSEKYDPFIELSLLQDLEYTYDSLSVSGDLLGREVVFNLDEETEYYTRENLQKNTRLILSQSDETWGDAGLITILYHPDLTFPNTDGKLELYGWDGQDRQLLDIVYILSGKNEKSTYSAGLIRKCGDVMDRVDDFSPSFSEMYLDYFSTSSNYVIKTVETVRYVGGGGGCSCPTKEQLCGEVKEEAENGSGKQSEASGEVLPPPPLPNIDLPLGSLIKIISLEPFSPESITLQSFLPYDADFSKKIYYLRAESSSAKKYIDGTLTSLSVDTFSKNFGFLDAGTCVSLFSGDALLDKLCYGSLKESKNTDSSSKQDSEPKIAFDPTQYSLKITHVDYDPPGSDTNNETISLLLTSGPNIDLSKLRLNVNGTNKTLSGVLFVGQEFTLKKTFGFPNSTSDGSPVLVSLVYGDYIFDTYSYNPNKTAETVTGTVKVYSVLDGDTFRFRKEDGSLQSVRLLGVDAPESNTARYKTKECFGGEAKNYLTSLLKGKNVLLEYEEDQKSVDMYGRLLAYVYLGDILINQKIIQDGYAKEYTYKQPYSKQSDFRFAQKEAETGARGLWSSTTCGTSLADETEIREVDYTDLLLDITHIDYDPAGSDKGNETITLSLFQKTGQIMSGIDFSLFSLKIDPRNATGASSTKSLSTFGYHTFQPSLTFTGDFAFPNKKPTCVSLLLHDYVFDTYCYDPSGLLSAQEELEDPSSEQTQEEDISLKILSLLPNPKGADKDKEEITLQFISPSLASLDLSQGFQLLINSKTKKKLSGIISNTLPLTIKGNFAFPNSESCISLIKGEKVYDTFCYTKPKEGQIFGLSDQKMEALPSEELALIKKIKLKRKGESLCITYQNIAFGCAKIPNTTTQREKQTLSFQNAYLKSLESYLRSSYPALYYNTEIKTYFSLLSMGKDAIKGGEKTLPFAGEDIPLTQVESLLTVLYRQSPGEQITASFVSWLPESIKSSYILEKEKYFQTMSEL